MDDHLTAAARQLIVDAEFEPAQALARATALLDGEEVDGHLLAPDERHLVLRAAGIAARQMGRFDHAEAMLTACIDEPGQDRPDRGHALTTRAGLFAMTGDFDRAFADLDTATECFDGPDLVHPLAQRAVVLHQSGELPAAAAAYDEALLLAQAANATVIEARLRSNLGVLWTHQADYDRASRELARSAQLYRSLGHGNRLLIVEHNLGYVAMCQGRIVDALRHFENQRTAAIEAGTSVFAISADLCHALMTAGLTDEAEAEAAEAARHFEDQGALVSATDAFTSAGRAALDSGDPVRAVAHLTRAMSLFDHAERTPWRAVAQVLLIKAHLAAGTPVDESGLEPAIEVLDHAGMSDEATVARLVALQLAVRTCDPAVAERRISALGRPDRLVPHLRSLYWLAVGQYRVLDGRPASAARAFQAGIRANERFRQDLSGIDVILSIGAVGIELATAGLQTALASPRTDPIRVMRWIDAAESTAANRLNPVQTSNDPGSARRSATLDLAEALREARSPEAVTAAAHRLHETERAERMQHRLAERSPASPADDTDAPSMNFGRASLQKNLDGTDLIMIGDAGDRFVSVVKRGDQFSCHPIGSKQALDAAIATVRARLRRAWSDLANAEQHLRGLDAAAADIETLLLPEVVQGREAPVVVTLPTSLRALPLGLLPSLRTRSFVTAPSLRGYLNARHGATASAFAEQGVLFVGGPGLTEAAREVNTAARFHPAATVLDAAGGDHASAAAVLNALPKSIVHFACHGLVRDDNPIFSSLQLSDGPLPLHRFADLTGIARLVILSGCDVGRPARRGRSHAVSLPRVLLDLGASSVIASAIAIPDGATADMMIELHKLLGAGVAPADALATVRASPVPATRLVASVFSCHGI